MWPVLCDDEVLTVWPGTVLEDDQHTDFLLFLKDSLRLEFPARVIGSVDTLPGQGGPGGRTDLLFTIHAKDIPRCAMRRLQFGMRWWCDVKAQDSKIYPRDLLDAYAGA